MAEETLLKGQKKHTPETIPPKQVESTEAAVEPEPEANDMQMEEFFETQDDILERQVALSIPIGKKIGEK